MSVLQILLASAVLLAPILAWIMGYALGSNLVLRIDNSILGYAFEDWYETSNKGKQPLMNRN